MTKINYYPGHMAKTKRLIKEQIKQIDIVFELLDARAPGASMNPEVSEMTRNKPRLMLLNKSDLSDGEGLRAWERHFANNGLHTLQINALNGHNVNRIVPLTRDILSDTVEKAKKRGMKVRPFRALIIGIPNVGKSTLINRLVAKKATKVGDVPGITRHMQVVRIHESLELLDTPGILWPNLEDQTTALKLALLGTIKDSLIPRDDVVIFGFDLLRKYYPRQFAARYDIDVDPQDSALDLFDKIGRRRGALTKGNEVDYDRVMDHFLYDFRHQQFGPVILEWPDDV